MNPLSDSVAVSAQADASAQDPGAEAGPKAYSSAFSSALDVVASVDPTIAEAIRQELRDQRAYLKLIASENYASPAVLLAMGNWLSDKYAEGHPRHRWYAGCDNVDTIELRAAELARQVFHAEHAYVQPHSGIDANLVAFWTILTQRVEAPALADLGVKTPVSLSDADWEKLRKELCNQRMLGMALDAGGHLTHGFRPNVSGKLFEVSHYSVDPETNLLDYDHLRKRAHEVRPLVLLAGYSSYPRKLNFRIFREIADEVDAVLMVDMAHFAGLVAGGVFEGDFNPVAHADITTTTTHKTLRGPRGGMVLSTEEYAATLNRGCPLVLGGPLPHIMAAKGVALAEASRPDFADYARRVVENASALAEGLMEQDMEVVTGGTDNHLLLLDVRPRNLTGRQAESALREAGITANRNVIPYDPNGSWFTSGVRLGTPAATTLGMGVAEMREIASIVADVVRNTTPEGKSEFGLPPSVRDRAREQVADLLRRFPLYPAVSA